MLEYLVHRLLGIATVLLIVSILAFLLMHTVPGGPFGEEKVPLPLEARVNILRKYGLDRPLLEQYVHYMGGAVQGDLGISYQSPTESVTTLLGRTWPTTIALGSLALVVAFTVGLSAGVAAAVHQSTWLDHALSTATLLAVTIPPFVVALALLLIFSIGLGWVPTGGWPSSPADDLRTILLPVLSLAAAPAGVIARYTRLMLAEVLHADYMLTARSKGLPERTLVMRHALKNASIPLITLLGPQLPGLLTGSVFVEVIFRIPGLARVFVTSMSLRDYPTMMATILLVALLWSATYLISDLLYIRLDPRVRLRWAVPP